MPGSHGEQYAGIGRRSVGEEFQANLGQGRALKVLAQQRAVCHIKSKEQSHNVCFVKLKSGRNMRSQLERPFGHCPGLDKPSASSRESSR